MKKQILIIILLLLPVVVNWWVCVGWDYYKIINYKYIDEEMTIKGAWFYDIFLFWPFFTTNNITILGSHYTKTWSKICEYENFENIKFLKYSELLFEDKKKILWNFWISFLIFVIFIYMFFVLFKRWTRKKYKSFKFYK